MVETDRSKTENCATAPNSDINRTANRKGQHENASIEPWKIARSPRALGVGVEVVLLLLHLLLLVLGRRARAQRNSDGRIWS